MAVKDILVVIKDFSSVFSDSVKIKNISLIKDFYQILK